MPFGEDPYPFWLDPVHWGFENRPPLISYTNGFPIEEQVDNGFGEVAEIARANPGCRAQVICQEANRRRLALSGGQMDPAAVVSEDGVMRWLRLCLDKGYDIGVPEEVRRGRNPGRRAGP